MDDRNCFEPARSFDIGTYIWAIGASLLGPELKAIEGMVPHTNTKTIWFGAEHIERSFEKDMSVAPIYEHMGMNPFKIPECK